MTRQDLKIDLHRIPREDNLIRIKSKCKKNRRKYQIKTNYSFYPFTLPWKEKAHDTESPCNSFANA